MAFVVVAPVCCAEHGCRGVAELEGQGHSYAELGTRDWLPNDEFFGTTLGEEEGTAVAAVDGLLEQAVGGGEGERRRGGRDEGRDGLIVPVMKNPEHGGRWMEIVEAAPEPALGDGLAPGLADEGRTEEAGGVVGRDAE